MKKDLQIKNKFVPLHPLTKRRATIFENTERDNEVKKEMISLNKWIFSFRGTAIS